MGDIASIFTRPYEKAKADEAIAREYLALKAKEDLTEAERARLGVYEQGWQFSPESAEQLAQDAVRRQELTQADYEAWKEGSLNKTLLHTFVGALQASLGGADTLSGALGAGAAEASRNLTEQLPRELQQWASAAVGAAAGAVAGGGAARIQTGAATAWSGEVYNRQLHISEHQRIRSKARELAQSYPPEAQQEVEQYWYLLMTSEAQAMVDAKFAAQREADLSYLGVLAADPTREAYFYVDDYVADRARARQFLLSMQGQPILDTSGQPIVADGGALVTFAATNDRQFQDHSLFAPGTPPWQQSQQFRGSPSMPELSGYADSQLANAGASRALAFADEARRERYATASGGLEVTTPELDVLGVGLGKLAGVAATRSINATILALGKGPVQFDSLLSDEFVVSFMGKRAVEFYAKDGATLGVKGGTVWVAPLTDVQHVSSRGGIVTATGHAHGVLSSYLHGDAIYGIAVPRASVQLRFPTTSDAGINRHFRPGGITGVEHNGVWTSSNVRERVLDGGQDVPRGSVFFQLNPDGSWTPIRRF